jgi:hypothetical protein
MKVENTRNIKQISADDGMWLCNHNHKAIRQKVLMSLSADETEWQEITEEEKARLEALWNTETPTETEATVTDLKAQAYDILMGVSE